MRTGHRRQYLLVGLSAMLALIWLCPGDAFSQANAHYRIERSVLDAGGGERESATYIICDSLGQVSGADVSTSASFRHLPGFYECRSAEGPPTPTPTPTPNAIPEPGTLILFGSGLVGMLILIKRRLKKF